MLVEDSQVISLLKEIHLFYGLDEARLYQVARHFTQVSYEPDQVIISDDQRGGAFYIILEGDVIVSRKINDVDSEIEVLVAGDFFGEEWLLLRKLPTATVVAANDVVLFEANREYFNDLVTDFPDVKTNLERIVRSRQFIRTHHFDWLNDDEVVYQVRRRHIAHLIINLLGPSLLFLLGFAITLYLFLGASSGSFQVVFPVLTGMVMAAGVLWGLWAWLDWSNDYYIATNQRVVWIEQIILLYESRVEAPLVTIQAVNVRTDLLGRILGYGDVTVNTYTGRVTLQLIADPYQMAALIQEQWHRALSSFQREQKEETVRAVKRILGREEPSPAPESNVIPIPSKGDDFQEPSFFSTYFGNIFNLRYEDGTTITYRKHWLILIRKTLKPFLVMLAMVIGMLACIITGVYNQVDIVSVEFFILIGVLLILLILVPWWLYNYIDWRNDIYQLTDKNIFDIERKPLGTEVRKSGSLDRILSLEHERPGFVGYLFNVGTVIINFGDAKFDFVGVYEPARIQQDIFNRMHLLRTQQQKDEIIRERERVLSILTVYHDNVQGTQQENSTG
jgi:uncharacterized membrane protein YdbT with pleckstrin-like domain